jgi:hypothetical protein
MINRLKQIFAPKYNDADVDRWFTATFEDEATLLSLYEGPKTAGSTLPPPESVVVRLNPAQVADVARARTLENWRRVLSFLRGVFTVAPLGVTWYSLAVAAINYSKYQAPPGAPARSFLELWQNNFDGQIAWRFWSPNFSETAFWDVGLVALLAFSTFVLSILNTRAEEFAGAVRTRIAKRGDLAIREAEKNRREHLRETLSGAWKDVGAGIAGILGEQLAAPAAALVANTTELGKQRERLESLATQRNAELDALASVSSDLKESTDRLLDQAKRVEEVSIQTKIAVEHLRTASGSLDGLRSDLTVPLLAMTTQADEISNSVREIFESHRTLSDTVGRLTTALETGQSEAIDRHGELLSTQGDQFGVLRDQFKELATELANRHTAQLAAALKSDDDRGKRLSDITQEIRDQHASLHEGLQALLERVPDADAIARAVTTEWATSQRAVLTEINAELQSTLLLLPEALKDHVVEPIKDIPLFVDGMDAINRNNGAVGQLQRSIADIQITLATVGSALDGVARAFGVVPDASRMIDIADRPLAADSDPGEVISRL